MFLLPTCRPVCAGDMQSTPASYSLCAACFWAPQRSDCLCQQLKRQLEHSCLLSCVQISRILAAPDWHMPPCFQPALTHGNLARSFLTRILLQVYPASYLAACIQPQGAGCYPSGTPGVSPTGGHLPGNGMPPQVPNGAPFLQQQVTTPTVVQTPSFSQSSAQVRGLHCCQCASAIVSSLHAAAGHALLQPAVGAGVRPAMATSRR